MHLSPRLSSLSPLECYILFICNVATRGNGGRLSPLANILHGGHASLGGHADLGCRNAELLYSSFEDFCVCTMVKTPHSRRRRQVEEHHRPRVCRHGGSMPFRPAATIAATAYRCSMCRCRSCPPAEMPQLSKKAAPPVHASMTQLPLSKSSICRGRCFLAMPRRRACRAGSYASSRWLFGSLVPFHCCARGQGTSWLSGPASSSWAEPPSCGGRPWGQV